MPQSRLRFRPFVAPALAGILVAIAFAAPAAAQSRFDSTIGVLVGVGGATDDDPDSGYSNLAGEVFYSLQTTTATFVTARLGQLDLQPDEGDGFLDSTLRYVAATGGYRFTESFYDSGIFLGIGAYRLEGDFLPDEDAIGFLAGVDGDFRLTDRLSFIGQLTGHFVDLDAAQFFLTAEAGLAFHF